MAVYMIRAGESGPVKIGHSYDPEIRLGQLQISHWEKLRIIRLFEGGEVEERYLHDRFSDLYIRGEWHSFSRAMLGDVGLVEICPEPIPIISITPIVIGDTGPSATEIGIQLAALRRSRRLTQAELASEVRVSRVAIAMIETGKDMPGRELLWRLDKFFGVAVIESVSTPVSSDAA
jgi:DNA-binding XRE family transcriptional regulator